jgi:hypothetical protein
MHCISSYSLVWAYKVEAENSWIDLKQSVRIKVMMVEGQGKTRLPRVLPEFSWEGPVDESANFSVKAVCGVKDEA